MTYLKAWAALQVHLFALSAQERQYDGLKEGRGKMEGGQLFPQAGFLRARRTAY